jgi:hypothetical protein
MLSDDGRVRAGHDGRDAALHGLRLLDAQALLGKDGIDPPPEAIGPGRIGEVVLADCPEPSDHAPA